MRKLSIFIVGLLFLTSVLAFYGCEGEKGVTGDRGDRGRTGSAGVDPERVIPADRNFAIGVANQHRTAVSGDKSVHLTFDSTRRGNRDTVVAVRVDRPPIIDGIDGDEFEWGLQRSRVRTTFLHAGTPGMTDPQITEVITRVAWDDEYIYTFLQWKEKKVTVQSGGRDSTVYDLGKSDRPDELIFNNPEKRIVKIEGTDTTFLDWVRVPILDVDTIGLCFPPPFICFTDTTFGDTTLVWLKQPTFEDQAVVMWSDEEVGNWSDYAFHELFATPDIGPRPANLNVDVWLWGAGRTDPVSVADDWSVTAAGAFGDFGAAPYLSNYDEVDSIPIYQNLRDPNLRSSENFSFQTYPFWSFNAVAYVVKGWDIYHAVFVPGVITTIPGGSRADVYARGQFEFSGGAWTVEMRRARHTRNADDVDF